MTTVPRLDASLLSRLDDSVRSVSEASTLPPELYTSADVLAFEREALFAHDWLCGARRRIGLCRWRDRDVPNPAGEQGLVLARWPRDEGDTDIV